MKELRLTMRLSNNRIKAILERDGLTMAEAAAKSGLGTTEWYRYLGLKASPLRRLRDENGRWSDRFGWSTAALKISKALGVTPEYLWPEDVLKVTCPTVVTEIDAADLAPQLTGEQTLGLTFGHSVDRDTAEDVSYALAKLSPLEEAVMRARFGFDGPPQTLGDVGKSRNLSRERIRQIQERALGKMHRHVVVRRGGTAA